MKKIVLYFNFIFIFLLLTSIDVGAKTSVFFDKIIVESGCFITPYVYFDDDVTEAKLIFAEYNNGILTNISCETAEKNNDEKYKGNTIYIPDVYDSLEMKAFLWKNDIITPIAYSAKARYECDSVPIKKAVCNNDVTSWENRSLFDGKTDSYGSGGDVINLQLKDLYSISGLYIYMYKDLYMKEYEISISSDGENYETVKRGVCSGYGLLGENEGFAVYFDSVYSAAYVRLSIISAKGIAAYFSEIKVLSDSKDNVYRLKIEADHEAAINKKTENYKKIAAIALEKLGNNKVYFVGSDMLLTKDGLIYIDENNTFLRPYIDSGKAYVPQNGSYECAENGRIYNDEIIILSDSYFDDTEIEAINELYNPNKTAADKLFQVICLKKIPELADAYSFYKNGNYYCMLEEYKTYFFNKIRKMNLFKNIYFRPTAEEYINKADYLLGRITAEEYMSLSGDTLSYTDSSIVGDGKKVSAVDWALPTDKNGNSYYGLDFLNNQIYAYLVTEDKEYLYKYLQITNDFFSNQRNDIYLMPYAEQKEIVEGWVRANTYMMHRSAVVKNTILNLARIAKYDGVSQQQYWELFNSLNAKDGICSNEILKSVPSDIVANIVYSLIKEYGEELLSEANSNFITNQKFELFDAINYISFVFDELADMKQIEKYFGKYYLKFIDENIYEDGGMLEAAFNYNFSMFSSFKGIIDKQKNKEKKAEFLQEAQKMRDYTQNMFSSLITPVGGFPRVGNYAPVTSVPRLWSDNLSSSDYNLWNKIMKEELQSLKSGENGDADILTDTIADCIFEKAENTPGFTSVAFPYSGYISLRNNWSSLGTQLFMMTARPAMGHRTNGNNGIEITAYGKKMITFGGPPWYNTDMAPEEQREEYDLFQTYFSEQSSYKANSVLVDGMNQRPSEYLRSTVNTVIGDYFYTSDNLDIAEGNYSMGYADVYGNRNDDVSHRRRVYYIKDKNIFIIDDTMMNSGNENHMYSQVWGFAPEYTGRCFEDGFGKDEVKIDGNKIYTCDSDGPNVSLYSFSENGVNPRLYYGYKSEDQYIGWYARAISGERTAKNDVHINVEGTEGETNIITVVIPYESSEIVSYCRDLSGNGKSGFEMKLIDGTIITYYSGDGIKFVSEAETDAKNILSVKNRQTEYITVFDCNNIKINDDDIEYTGQFTGEYRNEQFQNVNEIQIPKRFLWSNINGKYVPVYN